MDNKMKKLIIAILIVTATPAIAAFNSTTSVVVTNLPTNQAVTLPADIPQTLSAITAADSVSSSATASSQTQWSSGGSALPNGSVDTIVLSGGVQYVSAYMVGTYTTSTIDIEVTDAPVTSITANTALWIACPIVSVTQPIAANAVGVQCNTGGYTAIRYRASSTFAGTVTPTVIETLNYNK